MDFTSPYSTRIQESFDEDQERIFRVIRGSYTSIEPLRVNLLNYYRGLPITYSGTVLGVERGMIDLDVNPYQAVAIADDRYTFIRSKLFPYAIVARAQYVNIKKHIVSLTKLGYVEILAEKRSALQLELDAPVEASLRYEGMAITGKLVDLSSMGVGMTADVYTDVVSGTGLALKFLIPDQLLMKQTLLSVPASLVGIVGNSAPYRYKLKITPAKHQEHLISRYSFQRQVEIIRGIKERVG